MEDTELSKITYMGYIKGSASKPYDTHAEARQWLDNQLDNKTTQTEGWIFESIERVYKAHPPLVAEKIVPQADQTIADKGDASYSNSKFPPGAMPGHDPYDDNDQRN